MIAEIQYVFYQRCIRTDRRANILRGDNRIFQDLERDYNRPRHIGMGNQH